MFCNTATQLHRSSLSIVSTPSTRTARRYLPRTLVSAHGFYGWQLSCFFLVLTFKYYCFMFAMTFFPPRIMKTPGKKIIINNFIHWIRPSGEPKIKKSLIKKKTHPYFLKKKKLKSLFVLFCVFKPRVQPVYLWSHCSYEYLFVFITTNGRTGQTWSRRCPRFFQVIKYVLQ